MNASRALLATFMLAAFPALGCKVISAIIEIPSDLSAGASRSIAGSFDAISGSSGSGGGGDKTTTPNKQSYARDLREFTAAFAATSGSREDFLRGVSRIGEDHGMSHWEAEPLTPRAIGEGLRDAGWSEAQMAEFLDEVGRDKPAAQLALEGYRQAGG
jgi:type IV secretory pathway TrbL component